jgi:dolichyl-phosphate beta-glucosyltransferase
MVGPSTSALTAGIVVPCYNEAKRLQADEFLRFAEFHQNISFIFVNDGSTDRTIELLHRLKSERPQQMLILELPHNQGKAEAVRRGLELLATRPYACLGYWDADLATPLDAIPAFVEKLETQKQLMLVMGARVKLLGRQIKRHKWRHYLGRCFATCVSISLNLGVYDTQCGAKLFRNAPQLTAIWQRMFRSRWIFDVEILMRMKHAGLDLNTCVYEYPLDTWIHKTGSKIKARDFYRAFFELIKLNLFRK